MKRAGKTRTDFILEAARRAAEEALLDRALMVVGPEAYGEFLRGEPPYYAAQLRLAGSNPLML